MSLESKVHEYLRELRLARKASTENRARQILFEALPFINGDPRQGVIDYLDSCRIRGNSNRTLANKLVRLCAFFRQKMGVKLDVPRPRFAVRMPEVYSQIDLDKFLAACDRRQWVFHRMLLVSGMRMQEAQWLEWGNLGINEIHICAKPHWVPKTYEERRIPVPASLIEHIQSLPKLNALVFPTARGNPDFHMLRTCKRIAKRAGLDEAKWSLHGFRRTCITTLLRSGIDLRTVMAIAGQNSIKSTMRYLRPLEGKTLEEKIENVWR